MVFSGNKAAKALFAGLSPAKQAWLGGEMVWSAAGPEPVELWQLCFTAEQANSTVAMTPVGSAPQLDLEYSTDGTTWSVFTPGSTTVTLANVGDKVWLRAGEGGNQACATSSNNSNGFTFSGKLAASGDVMSLLDGRNRTTAITASHCFDRLFFGCS